MGTDALPTSGAGVKARDSGDSVFNPGDTPQGCQRGRCVQIIVMKLTNAIITLAALFSAASVITACFDTVYDGSRLGWLVLRKVLCPEVYAKNNIDGPAFTVRVPIIRTS